MIRLKLCRVAAPALVLALACAPDDEASTPPPGGGLTLLVAQTSELPGQNCPVGGTRVTAGLDTDRDAILDPEELAKVEYVCGAAPGEPPDVLTRSVPEAAGSNCPAGGTRIDAGRDASGDGVLGDAEVERTAYACAEPLPEPPPVLTRVDAVLPGTSCLAGGSAVRFGPDTDGDGTLDDAEVSGVEYVCETRALNTFTVRTQADVDLVSAASIVEGTLDIQIQGALDVNLSPTAVTGSVLVRSYALTGLGLYCWMIGGDVRVEGNAKLKRFWMGDPQALGGHVVVQDNPELDSLILPSGKGVYELYPYRYPGDVVIARNAKLPWFGFSYPTEVGGRLVIEGNQLLRSLFLEGLERVGGDFVLADNDAVEEFPTLEPSGLVSVGGLFDVRDNGKLVRLRADALESAGGLRLARNDALIFAQFSGLLAVLGSVYIEDNPKLSSGPTDPLGAVGGWFHVQRNASLSSLRQFDNLARIGEALYVGDNPRLLHLGLDRLASARSVTISNNDALAAIGPSVTNTLVDPPSLTRLEQVEDLVISGNGALARLVLPELWTVTSLTVRDNPLLPTCEATALPARYAYVTGNDDAATCP